MSSASKPLVGASCHRIGPSFGPSAVKPWARNFSIASPIVASCFRFMQKRDALIVKRNASGTAAAQRVKISGDWSL